MKATAVVGRCILVAMVCHASVLAVSPTVNCTDDMKRYTFTPCDPNTKKMLSVEYFKQACLETDLVQVRSPIPVDCVKMCGSGTYYAATEFGAECSWCPPGSSSNSGGRIINNFDDIPDDFVTYCSPKPCRPWSPDPLGGMLTSGNQSGLRVSTDPAWPPDESVRVELVTIVDVINLKNGGKFMCDYRVESEPYYDGLQVLVNGSVYVLPTVKPHASDFEKRFILTGVHFGWRRLGIPLPYGSTEIRLAYVKDRDQSSVADPELYGQDRAFVRDIVIEGVQLFAPTCTPCAAGTYAQAYGRQVCLPCPANTFSNDGETFCRSCPAGSWSPPGSEVCTPKPNCQPDDYVATYSACNPTTLTRTFDWLLAPDAPCIAKDPPPKSDAQPCSICMPGMQFNSASQKCEPCLAGQYRKTDGSCESCPQGTAAIPVLEFDGFDRFGSGIDKSMFSMQCTGACSQCPPGNSSCVIEGGFKLASINAVGDTDSDNTIVAIRSDSGNGAHFTSRLRYSFVSSSPGWFEMKYFFQHTAMGRILQENTVEAEVRLDHNKVYSLRPTATLHSLGEVRMQVPTVGDHVIDIIIAQNVRNAPIDETLFVLTYLQVHGDTRGAATTCSLCIPGHFCPARAAGYIPCPPGSYSAMGGPQCDACPMGEIAEYPASTVCTACPPGTTNHATSVSCIPICDNFVIGNSHFNLSKLADVYFGPLYLPGIVPTSPSIADASEVSRFYVSFCKSVNGNGTSTVCETRMNQTVKKSYACQRLSPTRSYSLGEDPAFAVDSMGRLTYGITGGDTCSRGGMARSTNVTLVCDTHVTPPGVFQYNYEEPHCHYAFQFRSPYACQTCTADDYEIYESPCDINGVVSVRSVRKPNSRKCVGGYEPPADHNITCKRCVAAFYEPSWSKCTNGYRLRMFTVKPEFAGCNDDGTAVADLEAQYRSQKLSLNETCRSIDVAVGANTFTAVSGVALLLIFGLIVIVFIIWQRYKRLHHAYGTLAQANAENSGWEMNEVARRNEASRNRNDTQGDDGEQGGSNDSLPQVAAAPRDPKLQDS